MHLYQRLIQGGMSHSNVSSIYIFFHYLYQSLYSFLDFGLVTSFYFMLCIGFYLDQILRYHLKKIYNDDFVKNNIFNLNPFFYYDT